MKTLNILRFILKITLFFLVLAIPVYLIGTIFIISDIENEIKTFELFNTIYQTSENKLFLSFILLLYFLTFTANVFGIYLFQKTLKFFYKMDFFNQIIIKKFKIIGYTFLASYLIVEVLRFIEFDSIVFFNNNQISAFANSLQSPINGFIIGLFFLIFSKVFHIAKIQKEENIELKQENELTI